MRLDGVIGDARKRLEPSWVAGMEPMYRPQPVGCGCALHQRLHAATPVPQPEIDEAAA